MQGRKKSSWHSSSEGWCTFRYARTALGSLMRAPPLLTPVLSTPPPPLPPPLPAPPSAPAMPACAATGKCAAGAAGPQTAAACPFARAARAHLLHATAVVLRVPLVAGLCGRRLRAGRRARSVSARAADTQLRGVGSSVRRSGQRALPEPRQAARYVQRMHASALNVLNASPGQHNRKLPIPKIR